MLSPPRSHPWSAEFDCARSLRQIFNYSTQISTLPSDPCSAGGSWEQGQAGRGWRAAISPPNHHASLSSPSILGRAQGFRAKSIRLRRSNTFMACWRQEFLKIKSQSPERQKRTRGKGPKFCLTLLKHLHSVPFSSNKICSKFGICGSL